MRRRLIMNKTNRLTKQLFVLLFSLIWNNGQGALSIQGRQTNCFTFAAATSYPGSLSFSFLVVAGRDPGQNWSRDRLRHKVLHRGRVNE